MRCFDTLGGLIALALLVVPGIIFFIRYSFAFLAIIDKKLGIRDGLAWSAKITQGNKMNLLLLNFVWFVLTVVLLVIARGIFGGFTGANLIHWEGPWLVNIIPYLLIIPWYTASLVAAYVSLSMNAKEDGTNAATGKIDTAT